MITVKLYGHLGKQFGRMHRFDIHTPAEAIRALRANFKGFAEALLQHNKPGYRILSAEGARSVEQLHEPMGGNTIKIVPYVVGAGKGVGQFIIGAHLVAAGFALGVAGYPTVGGIVMNIGVAMMIGGVSQMLFTPPDPPEPGTPPTNAPSYSFNGAVNTTNQGNPVPVCYGRLIVGSQVISGGMHAAGI